MIEPLVAALGWDLLDIGEVEREFRVYDGTFLDYALRVDGVPKLFLEAKALNKSLSDRAFIAQTVNYANNEGVVWCVLSNGLVYRVYKSNEPVGMERKLLFEVDLREAGEDGRRADVLRSLRMLSRDAVGAGALDEWGESVFTDVRVRSALATLGADPSPDFLRGVVAAVDGPPIEPDRLRSSLARILGQHLAVSGSEPLVGVAPTPTPEKASKPEVSGASRRAGATYSVEHHTGKKPSAIVDLFQQVDAFATTLGPDVQRRPTKLYIGYMVGKRSFFTLELQQSKILVYLSIPPADAHPWHDSEMRDVAGIGHFGMGDTEFVLRSPDQIDRLEALLKQSYLRNRR